MKLNWKPAEPEVGIGRSGSFRIAERAELPLSGNYHLEFYREGRVYEDVWTGHVNIVEELEHGPIVVLIESFPPRGYVGGYMKWDLERRLKKTAKRVKKNFFKNSFTE